MDKKSYKLYFGFSEEEVSNILTWLKDQDLKAISAQKVSVKDTDPLYPVYSSCWQCGYPYTGAIGGGVTYKFTPTSLGLVKKVVYTFTGEELDITDYENW